VQLVTIKQELYSYNVVSQSKHTILGLASFGFEQLVLPKWKQLKQDESLVIDFL
jgi:hypothetical protein